MLCPACKQDVPAAAAFCPHCGQKMAVAVVTAPTAPVVERPPTPAGTAVTPEPERQLWTGTFSAKGMYSSWAWAIVITILGIVGGILIPNPAAWIAAAIGLPVIWIVLTVNFLLQRWSVAYTLTSQRFLHQRGILRQVHNRVLLIDIEDVAFEQRLIERMVNVGTIKLTTTDVSDGTLVMRGIDNVQHVANLIDDARREEIRKRAIILQQHDHHQS